MASTQTISKTVLLQPGEKFVLPPDSKLIAAESSSDISSTCVIPELAQLDCYTAIIGIGGEEGSNSQLWEAQPNRLVLPGQSGGGNFKLTGFAMKTSLNTPASETMFSGNYGFVESAGISGGSTALNALKQELIDKVGGVIVQSVYHAVNPKNYILLYVTVRTTSAIANNLSLITTSNAADSSTIAVYNRFYQTSSTFVQAHPNAPTCPSGV